MKVKIKRIEKDLPLPIYETSGSVGFDILARESVTIYPDDIKLVPGNIIVETPLGYMLAVVSRSSTPRKKGLTMPHGFGVIDNDYNGENDEIMIQVKNFTDIPQTVERGDKIAQGVFVRVDVFEWDEVDKMSDVSRGAFGSTSIK